MAEVIRDGTGSSFDAKVDSSNRLFVTGSITSMPSVSVSVAAGSQSYLFGKSGTDYYPLLCTSGTDGGKLSIDGTFSASVTTGSEVYVKAGSIEVYNMVAGSIVYMPAVSVSVGSESWIKNFNELGSSVVVTNMYTGSISWQGERYGVSGIVEVSNRIAGSIVDMPNVTLNNPSTIGSFTLQQISGSVALTTNVLPVSGTLFKDIAGSVYVSNFSDIGIVGVSGTTFSNMTGSVRSQSVQITNPWIVSGTATVAGSVYTTGSIVISSANKIGVSGIVDIGNIVGVSGTSFSNIVGSVAITNSINVSTGSEFYLKSGTAYIDVVNTVQTAGSIWSMPNVSVSVGSESWIKGGSIQTYNPLGSTFVLGSIYVTGSVNIATPVLGISGTTLQNLAGSVAITTTVLPVSGTAFANVVGSFAITNIGSVRIINQDLGSVGISTIVGVSGTQFSNMIGSVRTASVQITSPWIIGGSVALTNIGSFYFAGGVGSIMISGTLPLWLGVGSVEVNNPSRIGSYTGMANGSIWFGGGVGSVMLSGTSVITGSVGISTIVGVSGTNFQNIIGSVRIIDAQYINVIPSGTIPVSGNFDDFTLTYKMRIDYQTLQQPVYVGLALPGVATSTAGWMLRKNTYDASERLTAVDFGSGNKLFDKVWDNRSGTGEVYS